MEPPPALAARLLLLCGVSLLSAAARPDELCPRKLDCSLLKRHFCLPGSSACGPCLPNHVETEGKKCVSGKPSVSLTDGDIDYFATLLNRQDLPQLHKAEEGPGSTAPEHNEPDANALPAGSFAKNRADSPGVTPNPSPATRGAVKSSPVVPRKRLDDALLLGLVVACTVAGLTALIVATVCWCRLRKEMKLAEKTDYSANKELGPPPYDKSSPVDKKLAQSAQMYHYQHQKQQMLSMEKSKDEPKLPDSNTTSDEENEDGDFTVYECPGLAPTGEMEVKNPLFDDSTLHHPSPKSQ